jgi:hypothetical protein
VLQILDNPEQRRRLSIAGRDRMLSNHARHRSMQRFDGIVDRCLAEWRGARGASRLGAAT